MTDLKLRCSNNDLEFRCSNADLKFVLPVLKAVSESCHVPVSDIMLRVRKRDFCECRQIIASILVRKCGFTAVKVAKLFSYNHGTVVHSYNTVSDLIFTNRAYRERYCSIIRRLISEGVIRNEVNPRQIDALVRPV